jgi:hypothetical protein
MILISNIINYVVKLWMYNYNRKITWNLSSLVSIMLGNKSPYSLFQVTCNGHLQDCYMDYWFSSSSSG